jgi:tRNA A-37 threonylcarbamoyl transferase component Bud32/tetratricopeptide (TPR) repeat protein
MELREQLQHTLGSTYTFERELRGGGMARVFVAEEARLGRKVVVKVLSPELAADISAERFEREIKLAASLQQANIVPVLTAGDAAGVPYYTMPFVEGEGLGARLRNCGAMSISDAVSVLRDVARALAYAHERGIVHRDIKPDNVLLSGGAAVVTDFGIAKAISASRTHSDGATLTQMGTAIGTPAYISPEQAAGDPAIDHRADIYSFGCMAYEMLTGKPPFTNRTPQRLMAAHLAEKPQQILEVRSDTPPVLAAMVMQCLEKDAAARPQAAGELFAALDATTTSDAGHAAMPTILLGGRGMLKKALAVYGGAFVAVAILAKAAIVGIGLPDWVFPGALTIMALGLPVILLTAYTQFVVRRTLATSPTLTPGGTLASATHGTIAAIAIKASPHVSWRRTTLGGVSALAVFIGVIGLFMLLRAFGIGPAGSLLATGKLTSRDPLLITDFKVSNTDSSLGEVASVAVRAALSQSSVISLVSLSTVAGELGRMQRPLTTRLDLPLAREVAQRQGIKAVVDGSVTGVTGGYILTLRLVTADSGVELASFQETGDGPRGLIAAADKLARELRGKIGESLRSVQATPPLAQVTTGSLEALRKYSAALRANAVEGQFANAASLAREAVAIDSTFASAWSLMAFAIDNAHMPKAPEDSAIERAFRYRDRLPDREKLSTVAAYYFVGPHRDEAKAAAAYEGMLQKGYGGAANNLSLIYARRGEYARAESLNLRHIGRDSSFALAYGNAAARELDQGKVKEGEAMLALMRRRFSENQFFHFSVLSLLYAKGQFEDAEHHADSVRAGRDAVQRADAATWKAGLALLRGRYEESRRLDREARGARRDQGIAHVALTDSLDALYTDAWMHGPSDRLARALDATLNALPLSAVAAVDRPYFRAATAYALSGRPEKARAILEQRQREIRDTALLRLQQPALHTTLAEIALADHKPSVAVAEFRRGDLNPSDSSHETPCGIVCLSFNLGRAFDAAQMPDSAIAMYERYIATPFSMRWQIIDPLALAGTHKRLGELYEAKGERQQAAEHYVRFIELWKNADPEFQPHVAEVRRKLARLADTEKR